MRKVLLLALALGMGLSAASRAETKSCDALKSEIEAKLKTKGVSGYTLDIVAAAQAKDGRVVGSCEGGAKRIVYKRS